MKLLQEKVDGQFGILEDKITTIQKDIYEIKTLVAGNGDPSKGLVVRFDRMEQAHERRNWVVTTALGASISAIVGLAGLAIKHFFF